MGQFTVLEPLFALPSIEERLAWAKKCALPLDWYGTLDEGEMLVKWYCGAELGPISWKFYGDWVLAGTECATEFLTVEETDVWPSKHVHTVCPRCLEELDFCSEPERLR